MNLINLNGAELLKQAQASAENRKNERSVKQLRDLIIAKDAFVNATAEIDKILKDIENNDALAFKRLNNMSSFVARIKSVVFDRSGLDYMRYRDEDDDVVDFD